MKKLSLLVLLACFGLAVNAQEVKFAGLDSSPADIIYYPLKAAMAKAGDTSSPVVKVVYSRPSKKGREIFGALEPFGKVYRLGANESTEIKFFKPVIIGHKTIKPGSYSLFAIPNKDKWTFIVNSQTDRWGAYTYNQSLDVVRVDVPVKTLPNVVEVLSMTFVPQSTGANLVVAWDQTTAELPIQFK
jgi:hypothetical protein